MAALVELTQKSDRELLAAAQKGASEAFGELVRRHQASVRGFLVNYLFDSAIADDLAQEVFLAALTKLDELEIRSSLRGWLMSTAKFKAIDYLRAKTRKKIEHCPDLDQVIAMTQLDGLRHLEIESEQGELMAQLDRCLKRLRDDHYALVHGFYFEKKSAELMAKAANKSSGSIRMTLSRIRKALAKCIESKAQADLAGGSR